jgi:hypothetical protein
MQVSDGGGKIRGNSDCNYNFVSSNQIDFPESLQCYVADSYIFPTLFALRTYVRSSLCLILPVVKSYDSQMVAV